MFGFLAFFSLKQCVPTKGSLGWELGPVLDHGAKSDCLISLIAFGVRKLAQKGLMNKKGLWDAHVHVGYGNSHKTVVPACTAFFLTIILFFWVIFIRFQQNSEVLDALGVQLCLCFGQGPQCQKNIIHIFVQPNFYVYYSLFFSVCVCLYCTCFGSATQNSWLMYLKLMWFRHPD